MKLKTNISIYLLLLICTYSFGQIEQYNYKRELKGITGQWHKVVLLNDIFDKVSYDLHDIRIFGISPNNDTIEAPYILQLIREKISSNEVDFKIVNTSHNEKGYYFTLEIPTKEPVNQIKLDFKRQNFDWLLTLEGSQNQQEWFTIVENYRILSIKNKLSDYQFTKVSFQNSKYRYFRLLIKSKEKPGLTTAKIALYEVTDAGYKDYMINKIKINNEKQAKQTVIDIDLEIPVPVSYLKIDIENTFDYYRPVLIKYLTDSFKTEQGWKYNYSTLTSGTLSSIEENEFKFNSIILRKLKIVINNHDNKPLIINTFTVKGYVHELVVRFTEPATYYLVYGNNKSSKPDYDISIFAHKIPEKLTRLEMGVEQQIEKKGLSEIVPLFINKTWLWIIMTLIILLLGWFSIKMIGKN